MPGETELIQIETKDYTSTRPRPKNRELVAAQRADLLCLPHSCLLTRAVARHRFGGIMTQYSTLLGESKSNIRVTVSENFSNIAQVT